MFVLRYLLAPILNRRGYEMRLDSLSILAVALYLLALLMTGGCRSRIEGGTTHDQAEAVTIRYGDLEYHDTRRYAASTQPTVIGSGQLSLDGFSAGMKPIVEKFKNSWQLGIGFIIVGVAVGYLLKRYVAATVLVALGVVAILYPAALLWLALGAIALVLWSYHKTLKELVSGGTAVLEMTPPADVNDLKELMRAKQSKATQALVRGMK